MPVSPGASGMQPPDPCRLHNVLSPVLEYVNPGTKRWKYPSDQLSESVLSVFTSLDSVIVNILIPCDG